MSDTFNFEDNLAHLKTIVADLESDRLPLKEAVNAFKEAMILNKKLADFLKKVETDVKIILESSEDEPV
jgi:exodeoxyribonuclease VII small subunit